jgi:putative membrane protein
VIKNFRDHAANERTYLAWVRTAIAMMTFGFFIERFDLILRFTPDLAHHQANWAERVRIGEYAGLALMAAGLGVLALATIRFIKTGRQIDDEDNDPVPGARFDIALGLLLFLLGCALLGYLVVNVFGAS